MTVKLGSLFDGSGGFPLSACVFGGRPVWASEIEPYPIAVTRERLPGMTHLGDISKINGAEIEPVDIITFGSPCQDLSVAGKRAGLKHESNGDEETTRSGLFMESVRIIKEMREATNGLYPRFAFWENVPGAFSSQRGEDFRIVLEELIKIAEPAAVMPEVPEKGWAYADCYSGDGWSIAYRVFDGQYWGVPQRRRRIHLIVDFRGECARKILFEREGLRGYFETGRTPWQGIAPDAQGSSGATDREGTESGEADPGRNAEGGSHLCGIRESIPGRDANHLGTETGRAGGRGLNAVVPYTLKIRSGCDGGGKGALIRTDESFGIKTKDDQVLFQSVTFEPGIAAREGGHIYEGVSGTIRANAGDNRMAVAHADLKAYSVENHPADSRVNIDESGKVQTLTSRMGTCGGNVPLIMEQNPVYCLQGNGIDRADTAGCNGKGVREDVCYTLNTIDRPAVCYCIADHPTPKIDGSGKTFTQNARDFKATLCVAYGIGNGQANKSITEEQVGTLNCMHDQQAVLQTKPQYIVRRLTPTECARLQGFPDWWGHISEKADLTDEEYRFWLDVRNTHARINGKAEKEYTKKQMLTWYNKLHTDGAEYKMWGNGIALPPALYCMQGIMEVLNAEKAQEETTEEPVREITEETTEETTEAESPLHNRDDSIDSRNYAFIELQALNTDTPEEEQRDPALPEEDNIMEEKEDELMDPTTIHAPADREARDHIAQTAEQTPEGFDAVERLYQLKDEREKLANLTGNTRFADDVRALKYAVTVLEAVGL